MSFILPFKELGKEHVSIAGGKGAQLGEMTQAGISVPPGFVVLTAAFEEMLEENSLKQVINELLKKTASLDNEAIEEASKEIRDIISKAKIPQNVEKEILSYYKELDAPLVAVRSSATAEDAAAASWAGELETYLNVTHESLLYSVKKCWSSLFTARAIFYRVEKGLLGKSISVAVVVQKMVQSEVSGVAFTVHPVTKDYNQMVIEAGFGLGEAIVGGLITPDNYVIDKEEDLIVDIMVSQQEKMICKQDGVTQEFPVPAEKQEQQKLDGKQIMELASLCKLIEKHYGKPQDIEWAFAEGKFYITQSRPITTL